jgi:hypothetical protein
MRSILPIVFLFIISSVFILIGAWILNSNTKLANNGIVTDGRVVSIEEDYDIDNGSTYYPVVEFELEDGSRTTVKMSFGSNPPSYDLGEACEVIYYAGEQDSAKINSTFELYVFPWIFIGIGILVELIAIFIFIKLRRKNNNSNFESVELLNKRSLKDQLFSKKTRNDKQNPFFMD